MSLSVRHVLRSSHTRTILLSLAVGFSVPLIGQNIAVYKRQHCNTNYHLLNPRGRCWPTPPPIKEEYDVFGRQLDAWIREQEHTREVTHVSVYFRDLENGPWFGIEQDEPFSPASLLKVPIMLAILKQTETNPGILAEEIGYTNKLGNYPNIQDPEKTLIPNHSYTVDELLRRMIVYSDNTSKELLKVFLHDVEPQHALLDETYNRLGILRHDEGLENTISVKTYSSIFRILYNASYLSKEMSEKALELLTDVEFRQGLVAGVPETVKVAHKFGVRDLQDSHQLHDCGIIYYPQNPYILCVMTRGKEINELEKIIREVSRMIFNEIQSRN